METKKLVEKGKKNNWAIRFAVYRFYALIRGTKVGCKTEAILCERITIHLYSNRITPNMMTICIHINEATDDHILCNGQLQ